MSVQRQKVRRRGNRQVRIKQVVSRCKMASHTKLGKRNYDGAAAAALYRVLRCIERRRSRRLGGKRLKSFDVGKFLGGEGLVMAWERENCAHSADFKT